jgi:hypothetical protein
MSSGSLPPASLSMIEVSARGAGGASPAPYARPQRQAVAIWV